MNSFFKICCGAVLAFACSTPLSAQQSIPMVRMGGNVAMQQQGVLYGQLAKLPNVSKIRKIETPRFAEKYEVFIEQALTAQQQPEFLHRYMIGLYHILQELVKRFPEILFESCASGGNRFDLGILCYFPQIWASDDTDALCRAEIQKPNLRRPSGV